MPFTTYAELQTEIANWLNRGDLTSQIPEFISLAEAEIKRVLESQFVTAETISIVADDGDYTMPSNLIGDYEMYIVTPEDYAGRLNPVSVGQLYDNRRENYNVTGRPQYFAIQNGTLFVSPVPDQSYSARLVHEGLAVLSDSNTSNYVLTNAPDLYLYGALSHASPYLKDDERVSLWQFRFDKAIKQLQIAKDRAEWPSTPVQRVKSLAPVSQEIIGR